jgi:hypothetical protein
MHRLSRQHLSGTMPPRAVPFTPSLSRGASPPLSVRPWFRCPQDITQASKYANLAVKHDRYNAKALVNMGNVLLERGDLERAKELYLEAIGVEADCVEAIFNLGLVRRRDFESGSALSDGCDGRNSSRVPATSSPRRACVCVLHGNPIASLALTSLPPLPSYCSRSLAGRLRPFRPPLALRLPLQVNKQLGVFHEALQAFEKLHTLAPAAPEVMFQIANLHEVGADAVHSLPSTALFFLHVSTGVMFQSAMRSSSRRCRRCRAVW